MKREEEFQKIKQEFKIIQEEFYKQKQALDDKRKELDTAIIDARGITESLTSQKDAIHAFSQEIDNKKNSLAEQISEVEKNIQDISKTIEESQNKQNEFSTYYDKIFGDINSETNQREGGLKQEIEAHIPEMEKIHSFFQDIDQGNDEIESLEKQRDKLYKNIQNINKTIEESQNKQNGFSAYYDTIFGDIDSETNQREGGLKQEIDTRRKELTTYKKEQETAIETLKERIKSLLPGATSTGLATAFHNEKKSFTWSILLWNILYTVTIVALVWFAFHRVQSFSSDISTWQNIVNFTILGFPIFLPLVWFAGYCAKRRSEYSMLKQEYAHKETFASSYSSYKEQIDKLQETQDDHLPKTLLEKAINIIAKNPTHVLKRKHSSDLPLEEMAALIKACKGNTEAIEGIVDRFISPQKQSEKNKNSE